MAGQMKILCRECGYNGIITKTERLHLDFSRIYCLCKNPQCRHHWVASVSFSHTTKESHLSKNGFLHYVLEKLPREELAKIRETVDNQLALL